MLSRRQTTIQSFGIRALRGPIPLGQVQGMTESACQKTNSSRHRLKLSSCNNLLSRSMLLVADVCNLLHHLNPALAGLQLDDNLTGANPAWRGLRIGTPSPFVDLTIAEDTQVAKPIQFGCQRPWCPGCLRQCRSARARPQAQSRSGL